MGAEGGSVRYKVNTSCTQCGRSFSYWNDDPTELKVCPRYLDADHWPTERELVAMPADELHKVRKRCPDTWDQGNDYS